MNQACRELRLIETSDEYVRCLQEITGKYFGARIRKVFAVICTVAEEGHVKDIPHMWETFKEHMIDDYVRVGHDVTKATNLALLSLRKHLHRAGKDLADYGLPEPDAQRVKDDCDFDVDGEEQLQQQIQQAATKDHLNAEHKVVFDAVIEAVSSAENGGSLSCKLFYVDGPARRFSTILYCLSSNAGDITPSP